ncbi:MAG: hypothetical protein CM15mP115_20180 [Alphaproteobacteria bacterium]|nr:MAG: hypothetical protein CM15mP115_20180 [Alphaproteobacteria bacterium]
MGTSLREEMINLSLFGGRLALAELILFSVFLTDILLLGIMGEINLSGVLLANAAFVLCYVTALGFLQGALPLAAQRFEAGDRGGYHAIVAMSLLLGGGMAVLVLLIFLVFPGCAAPVRLTAGPDRRELALYFLGVASLYAGDGLYSGAQRRHRHRQQPLVPDAQPRDAGSERRSSYVLGFGISLGGLTITGMGTSGIALASTIVDSMLFAGFVWLLNRSGFRLSGIPVDALTARRRPMMRRQLSPATVIGIPIGIVFFVDSTLFSSALMLAGRHDVQGMAAIGLIFEWSALAIMVPVGLSEAIVQRVASATGNDGPQRTTIAVITRAALMVCSAYVALLAFIHFGLGINLPVYFIIDAAAHPDLVARLDDLALLAFSSPPFMPSSSCWRRSCAACWM